MSSINSKRDIKAFNYVKAFKYFIPEISLLKYLYKRLSLLKEILNNDTKIKKFFLSPLNPVNKKKEILAEVLIEKSDNQKINYFFEELINNNDLKYLDKINEILFFEILSLEGKNFLQIITATNLEDFQKDEISKILYSISDQNQQKIDLNYQIDSGIKGGYIINFKNKVYDDSLKRKFSVAKRIIDELTTS